MRSRFLKKLKILFVEDEQKIASLIKEAIGGYFYKFLIAKDGAEALEIYYKFAPDIVIADINMPILNGLDMAKEIRKDNKEIPIIILSAFSEKEKLFQAIDVGVGKYFLKPYDPDALLDYIEQLTPMLEKKTIVLCDDFIFNKTGKLVNPSGCITQGWAIDQTTNEPYGDITDVDIQKYAIVTFK